MSGKWVGKQQASKCQQAHNRLENKMVDFGHVTEQDLAPTYFNKELGILGCKHYQRATKLQGHCCGRWFSCRFCHDEVSDHAIVRYVLFILNFQKNMTNLAEI